MFKALFRLGEIKIGDKKYSEGLDLFMKAD